MLCAAHAPACLAPPALLPNFGGRAPDVLDLFPPETEGVELEVVPGSKLRGVFVPAEPGAPVVLHLQESASSVASTQLPFRTLVTELADLGWSSLVVDWRGVGVSDGERSVDHLGADALCMWHEAVRRAGGDARRVAVRATSLGTIAAAELLASGVRPAAVVLVAPVMPRTVTARMAGYLHGPFVAWIAKLLYRSVSVVDPPHELSRLSCPLLAYSSHGEQLVSEEERARLARAVEGANGRWILLEGDHVQTSVAGRRVFPEEIGVLRAALPEWPPAEARACAVLDALPPKIAVRFGEGSSARERLVRLSALSLTRKPELVAAAALGNEDSIEAARLLWHYEPSDLAGLSFDDCVAALSLDDPAGRLSLDTILGIDWALSPGGRELPIAMRWALNLDQIQQMVGRMDDGYHIDEFEMTISLGSAFHLRHRSDLGGAWTSLRARGLSEEDVRRQLARCLLKATGIPDRVCQNPDGSVVLEVFEQGSWRTLRFDPPEAPEPDGSARREPG
jgi:pimeloyl-ACP methyl ester carboxylesterase